MICSRSTTFDNIGYVNSIASLNSTQLLSMKTKIVMPSPRIIQNKDTYCRKYWQQIGTVFKVFLSR